MESLVFLISLLCSLYVISAQDPLQAFLNQSAPCFRTKRPRRCYSSLAESFTPRSKNLTNIEPRTQVYLFTPTSPNKAETLHKCGGALPYRTTYDKDAYTEIFIHGWLDGVCRTAWMRESKEEVFERAKKSNATYNVILVDWTWGNTPDYYIASQNCKIVGEQIGFVIKNIMRQMGVGPEKFHIIGHSFGAISAGFAGRSVPGLRRITALDPSVSPFRNEPADQRVTYRDAKIVDVIHTNIGPCFPYANGDPRQLGHADFYPNGGAIQTSCIPYIFISFLKGDILYSLAGLFPPICSHLQSIQYYKVSINPEGCGFVGVSPSNERAVMGMDYETYRRKDGKRLIYYLTTTNKCPYYDDENSTNRSCPECKEQLFQRARKSASSYNVILVDWTWGNTPDFYIASQNCKIVGEQIGFVIRNIMRQTGVGPEKFHIVGHSFGAIAAGFAGRSVPGLRRITALDPALAPFAKYAPDESVSYKDAKIVDIIHSNSGPCFPFTNGDPRPLGHADFYPNGGTVQTSCISYLFISFLKGDILYGLTSLFPPLCSHLQSLQYYKLSINPKGCEYVGVASDSYLEFLKQSSSNEWAVMGMDYELYHNNDGVRRKYYLTTTCKCPYYDDRYLKSRRYSFNTSCTAY